MKSTLNPINQSSAPEAQPILDDLAYLRTVMVNLFFVGPPQAKDREWVLVDAGMTGWADRIARAAEKRFGPNSRPADGQPYVQYRGGPPGFLKVIDDRTLGFADFGGNRQYITLGNLSENPRAFLFLMDYANRRRVKVWGTALAVEVDQDILDKLRDPAYPALPERAILFTVKAWDVNCEQHIHERYSRRQIATAVEALHGRIAELEAELERLRTKPSPNNH
jgi:predicted pyridoxine 5'-phosphate oxidase superfamily flavin-nucleotide-binding protein